MISVTTFHCGSAGLPGVQLVVGVQDAQRLVVVPEGALSGRRVKPNPFVKSDVMAGLPQLSDWGQTSQPFCSQLNNQSVRVSSLSTSANCTEAVAEFVVVARLFAD